MRTPSCARLFGRACLLIVASAAWPAVPLHALHDGVQLCNHKEPRASARAALPCKAYRTIALDDTEARERLDVRISFGHRSPTRTTFSPRLMPGSPGLEIAAPEKTLTVGAGAVDSIAATVSWPKPTQPLRKPHEIWAWLLANGEPGQIARLKDDPGLTPDAPVLTVLTAADGTRGFSVGLQQLARHRAMWLPMEDAFVTVADAPVDFAAHVAGLQGERVLDRVKREPEATLADFTARWVGVGNPDLWNVPWQTQWLGTVGHLVGTAARHGSLYKFGIDRWASVRPDHASPHKFRFDPLWPGCKWAGQRIVDGLPVLITAYERNGQRCEVEQFAAPLRETARSEPPDDRSVFHTRVRITGDGEVNIGFRLATENKERHPELRQLEGRTCVVDRETGAVWLMVEPGEGLAIEPRPRIEDAKDPRVEFDCVGRLAAGETRSVVLKLPSPSILPEETPRLAARDFEQDRAATVRYWESHLAAGARFEVPEPAVNELFRANLWHALILPRFREGDRIDLPYSNFAYGQLNADWPINQAVYVDYMLYGLRGHFDIAENEFAAMFQSQQKPDGRIGGYAEWGVYSPGMLYAVGQNYLLSRDRRSFERLLPESLKALDWCLAEVARGQRSAEVPGLIVAPLNDLTHESRAWAFPNAYFVAGLDIFGRALAAFGHPRGGEVLATATKMRADVERAFARAAVRSPVVQLADGTWSHYVPTDALTPRRLLDQWYPTDVDCGPLHLSRLSAIDPRGFLTTAMLHDHEDNLFLNGWGAANEPVYNQQATAYLLRDEPEAAIRAFYSMMACAFSHHQLSPLEHRWAWGQYFGPPSTDGAWFDLYRHMLIQEGDDDTLLLCQATPRRWLEDGKRVRVERAPTWHGPVTLTTESAAAGGKIRAAIQFHGDRRPKSLRVRFRHPDRKKIVAVTVNDVEWRDFDPAAEWVTIPDPSATYQVIVVRY